MAKEKEIRDRISKRVFEEADKSEQMKIDDANQGRFDLIICVLRHYQGKFT